jgi:hypothetical protein
MRSRLEADDKSRHMLRAHEELLLNWFGATGEISAVAVEGLIIPSGLPGCLQSHDDDFPNRNQPINSAE